MTPAFSVKYVHTNLTGRDWRVLVRFYCEVFGCVPKPPQRDLSGAWLDALTSLSEAHLTGMHVTLPGYGRMARHWKSSATTRWWTQASP